MKQFYEKYKHGIPVIIYLIVYLLWFFVLERHVTTYRLIHTSIDDHIPFLEFFVVPYYFWFVYVVLCVGIVFFKDKEEYFRTITFLMTGMTIFLLISTFFPNGHNLRPMVMPRDNVFSRLVARLYSTDTPTNLWPSIHVYNSIGAHLCICHSRSAKVHKWMKPASFIVSISIILSTVFIKQHSMFDVMTALAMAALMALIVYRTDCVEHIVTRIQNRHTINHALRE